MQYVRKKNILQLSQFLYKKKAISMLILLKGF